METSSVMNILCAADEAYVPQCGIMLTSLFDNNSDSSIHVYMLTDFISEDNKERLLKLADIYNQKIDFVTVDKAKLSQCPIRETDHVSLATYYRLLTAVLLPESVDKILYLDCDMTVADNLKELWDTDVEDAAIAGCLDDACFNTAPYERLKYDSSLRYVNAGVLLINLKYWREHNLTKVFLDYIAENADNLLFHDQDTLNFVCRNSKKTLPLRYNLLVGFLLQKNMKHVYAKSFRKEIWEAIGSPAVIHYSGPTKPWKSLHSKHPYAPYFYKYLKKSLWKDMKIPKDKFSWYNFRLHLAQGLGLSYPLDEFIVTKQFPSDYC